MHDRWSFILWGECGFLFRLNKAQMLMRFARRFSLHRVTLIPVLALSLCSSAFASSVSQEFVNVDASDPRVPDTDDIMQSKLDVDSMFQPVPASLGNFELSASGMALAKREGRDGPFTDAELKLRGSVMQDEGTYLRFNATGTVVVDGNETYNLLDAEGTVIFFKHTRGDSIVGLLHIAGKNVLDGKGNDLEKFRLRAHVIDNSADNTWRVIASPAGKLGDNIMLVNMDGTIKGIQS